jgi:hypothetical protein
MEVVPMKYALSMSALLLALSQQQPALAQGNADNLVKQAVAAQGGAVRRLRFITSKQCTMPEVQ